MFYPTLEDSLSLLAPYFAAGLDDNEFCFWVVPGHEKKKQCKDALALACPDLGKRLESGQIEIVCPEEWYVKDGVLDADTVLEGWVAKLDQGFRSGFEGIRIAGDTSWLTARDWAAFAVYEKRVGDLLEKTKCIAICCYKLDSCDSAGVIDVVSNHQVTMIKEGENWSFVENAERRKALRAVLDMEERFSRTVNNIPLVIYSALPDEHSTSTMVTDKITELTGYTPEELMDDPELFAKIVHPDDRDRVWQKVKAHRETKSPLKLRYRIVAKDGTLRWVKDEALPVLDRDGRLVRIDGFMEDISDLVTAEENLRTIEERYELAQRGAKLGVWDWNIGTGSLVWSDDIEPMFGFHEGGFGKTYEAFLQCLHPDDRKLVEDGVAACVEKGTRYDVEHRVIWPDGSVHWMSEAGDVIRDDNGKAVRMLGVVRDITSRKNIEDSMRRLNTELEASNKELEAFCYSVSHDLRAPLRRIDGFSQLLMEDSWNRLEAKDKVYLDRIRASTRNMDRLIDDLLRLSRISTAEISKERVDITALAYTVAGRLSKADPSRDVKFSIESTPPVHGDRHLLEIAITNLLENAWKFTRTNPKAEIKFGSEVKDGQEAYFVKDNGVGFDMARSGKLFEPFQRLHSTEDFPGNGIGLAIVNRVISKHQGRIWAEAEAGKGASFYFTITNGADP
jgi:PAS domain S-box-containing protein